MIPKVKKAIVLLSGGLDSAVTLSIAKKQKFECFCLSFDYGQRHKREIESAKKIAQAENCPLEVIRFDLLWLGSSLLDTKLVIPQRNNFIAPEEEIPSTYVPARNIIFLSFALSYAEAIDAEAIFIGAHAQDYSGYPDCRPEFYQAFKKVAEKGTKRGVRGNSIRIKTPLLNKTKAEIIQLGLELNVAFEHSWSCYEGGLRPCGSCDSCYFRAKGFAELGIVDPGL